MAWMDVPNFRWLTDSTPSPGVAQAFALGFQGRQREMDRALQVRELDLRTEQQEILNELRTEKLLAEQVRHRGMQAMASVVGKIARENKWNDPVMRAEFWDTAAKYPQLMTDPSFKELTQQFELADQADLRKKLSQDIGVRQITLEETRQANREALQAERFEKLAELQEDSQEAKLLRDEILHGFKLDEQSKRPSSSGVSRFDLPWTAQETMKAELNAINRDLFAEAEDKAKRIEQVYRKYQAMAKEAAKPQPPQSAPKILKFNPATGKFE